jgi:hypothetical protein
MLERLAIAELEARDAALETLDPVQKLQGRADLF